MDRSLFRREVLEARRAHWLGSASLSQPAPLWLLTLAAAISALAIAIFLIFGTYTRRSTTVGHLAPVQGLAAILSPATGVVGHLYTREGQHVDGSETLAVVNVPRTTPAFGDTQAAIEERLTQRQSGLQSAYEAQQDQLQARADGLRSQLRSARRELAQMEAEVATRQMQARIARETLERLRKLQGSQYVSLLQIEQQESSALDYAGMVQTLERQVAATSRVIAQLEQSLHELPGLQQAAAATLLSDLGALEQERVQMQAQGELSVTSPVTGIVANQLVKVGQAVQAGQPILSVLPGDGMLQAELLVPSRAIGFVEPGDHVFLRYQAYPYQKFGLQRGKVEQVSRDTLGVNELGSSQAKEPYYRVTVSLSKQTITAYGEEEQLKPGMLVEADIMKDRRRLIEWVFEPLYSIKGKVGSG